MKKVRFAPKSRHGWRVPLMSTCDTRRTSFIGIFCPFSSRCTFQFRPGLRSCLQVFRKVACLLSPRSDATSRPIFSQSSNPRSSVESFGPILANKVRTYGLWCHRESISFCDCAEMKPKQNAGFSANPSAAAEEMLKRIKATILSHLIKIMCHKTSVKTIKRNSSMHGVLSI